MTRKFMTHKFISMALLLVSTAAATSAAVSSPTLAQSTPASNAKFPDHRIAINLSLNEKNQILTEMREFLHGLHGLNLALARQDMKSFALIARPMGLLHERIPNGIKERLPEEFSQLTIALNESFQILARDAEAEIGKDPSAINMRKIHENMAEVLTYCAGCHDTYRFNVVPVKRNASR